MVLEEGLNWSRLPGETAEEYVERVGGWPHSNMHMRTVLGNEFGIPENESKRVAHGSRSFHERFVTEHLTGMLARGGSRYGAVNFVRRKYDWSDAEIAAIVDSVGKWKR